MTGNGKREQEPRTADKGTRNAAIRNVGKAWNWDRGPGGDLSGRQRQDFDRYATVREEEKKTTTLF